MKPLHDVRPEDPEAWPATPLALDPLPASAKRAALEGEPPHGLDDAARPLLASWQRSRRLGVDPDGRHVLEEVVVDAGGLRDARERTSLVRHQARAILDDFGRMCAHRDFVAVLTDAEGTVAASRGGGAFLPEARRLRLVEGTTWGEEIRGTNAVGTALVEGRPVAVRGAAHYARVNEGLVCFAAPIRDPRGEVVAVLDATSLAERAHALDAGVVATVVRSIEEVLRAYTYAQAGGLGLVERVMERSDDPAFLVEAPGRIARANAAGRAHLAQYGRRGLPRWETLHALAERGRGASAEAPGLAVEAILEPCGRLLAVLVFLARQAAPEPPATASAPPRDVRPFRRVLGHDPALVAARERCLRLAASALPVLLLAETGTGKELFARAVHDASPRAAGPFVALNCGTLQPELLQSELFGHGPGAYTGASPRGRGGRIAAADGGTLFLDEVADLPPEAQVSLLRVLEDGTYTRVGEDRPRRADIRIVAATCRDLRAQVAAGRFREDLFFRIGGACVELPPLRARTDLDALVDGLWRRVLAAAPGRGAVDLSPPARAALAAHDWPGNVRELESALRFAALMADGATVEPEHLPPTVAAASHAAAPAEPLAPAAGHALDDARRASLERALATHAGNVSAAARTLGVARSTVYRLARRYGLSLAGGDAAGDDATPA